MSLQEHPTWKIHDASKISAYLSCPRAYMYKYILGWELDTPDVHRHFGKCWHLSMEHLLLHGMGGESYEGAVEVLTEKYREVFSEETDLERSPKTPGHARLALAMYCKEFRKKDHYKVLHTEISGAVPISEKRVIHFKMDSIMRDLDNNDLIKSLEHKTGSQNSQQWRDGWKLSVQTGTYNHVLFCAFPTNEVWGVEINGAIFTKSKIAEFPRVPVRRTPRMMDAWLVHINQAVDKIEADYELLKRCKEEDEVLEAFAPAYNSCSSYRGCPYFNFCLSWSNPLQRADEIPEGFRVEYWDPSKRETKHKIVLKGGKIT
ncbi:MAG: PD-(D/E)XK nuclease family protein [bacterium]|nr:PD-(D/E)XK nuclease family protein [bacterium]